MAPPPGFLEVRCAGCGETLEVEHGLTEFGCPDCGMAQALPPELMPPRPRRALPLPGRGAPYAAATAPARVACGGCGSVLSVPHGPGQFACPLCGTELAPSPLAAVPVVVTPAAVPICSTWPAKPSEVLDGISSQSARSGTVQKPIHSEQVLDGPSSQSARAGTVQKPIHSEQVLDGPSSQSVRAGTVQKSVHSEQTYAQRPKHYFGEESFNSFRADTRTQIAAVRRLQNEPPNPSIHREESHIEPLRPGKKKYRFVVGPKYGQAGNLQEHRPIQVVHASEAQGKPSKSSVHTNQIEGGFLDDAITVHDKQKTKHVVVPSAIEHEQSGQAENIQEDYHNIQVPEAQGKSSVHANQVEGGFLNDAITVHDKQKTKHVAVPSAIEHEQISSLHQVVDEHQGGEIPSDVVHLEQDKVDFSCEASEKNKKSAQTTKGNQKRRNKSLMNDPKEWCHLRRSKRLSKGSPDRIDTEPIQKRVASPNQNKSEAKQIESTVADPDPSSPTRYRCPLAGSSELDNIDATTPPTLNHGTLQTKQSPRCYSQMYSPETGWALPNPSSNSWNEHESPQKSFNGIDLLDRSDEGVCSNPSEDQNQYMDGQVAGAACSGQNHSEQVRFKSHSKNFAENGRQINLAASCSRLAALLPVPGASTLPTIALLSSVEELPCSSPTTPHRQPQPAIYSQCGDMLSGSLTESSKKRRGRRPAVLMEPRKEADRPVLTPNGTHNWSVQPPCPKVSNTLSLLIKQNYPGTYVSVDTDGKPCELVVHYWHQYSSAVKATVLDEFLKRYKWPPAQEEECQKIFDRRAVRQLVNLFCYEKQRVREELAAKNSKRTSKVGGASGEMALATGDEFVVLIEPDDPQNWKPFVPDWMQPTWWEMLCDHWAKDEFMKVSYQKRKNRNAGNHPCNTAGSRSIAIHQDLMDTKYQHTEKARDTLRDLHPVQEQVGSSKRGMYYDTPVVSKKAQIDSSSKSSPDCFSKQVQHPKFTQEQVQQMIHQALEGLNKTWEKKFLSLEQNIRRTSSSSHMVPVSAKGSVVAVTRDKECQLARQDTLDSVEAEEDPAARDEDEDQDDHWS
ncbi:uncharacterized protein LOC100824965 isoform X2 [Brachypodium distachyon]|uniref:uncharacterized protein LOC100824965 isoform X2 n=1 Tax=Brachypodium distachyon TaxID=15368 RepID=UPI000D0D4F07|nr:uncharacterized protein LOC100824965 isoform X2 [Brachypodium distachyon]|eukprot:XP_024311788.1 uncharacterized protein LOC100824965 isoform X2 [Brachypodium distachyon]